MELEDCRFIADIHQFSSKFKKMSNTENGPAYTQELQINSVDTV